MSFVEEAEWEPGALLLFGAKLHATANGRGDGARGVLSDSSFRDGPFHAVLLPSFPVNIINSKRTSAAPSTQLQKPARLSWRS